MSKCARCGNEQTMCACPKGAGKEQKTGKIILLCGTSTAGKTSICTAAQIEANNTGNSWHIDGADIAMEKAWTELSEIDGVKYQSGEDHFVAAMKAHDVDAEIVDRASSVFGARTLAVAVLSRQNLGNPTVDTVNLIPETDIKIQAQKVHSKLSSENKEKYSVDSIEDLLTIIKNCPEPEELLTLYPYPPLAQLNERMLERAIIKAKSGESTILDMVGNEMLNGQLMTEQFKARLQEAGLPDTTGEIVVVHCPINTLMSRIDTRNDEAREKKDLQNIRQAFFPFTQYGKIYERTLEPLDSSKPVVGEVSRQDIVEAATKFGGGNDEVSALLNGLGFKDGDETVYVTPKFTSDKRFQTSVLSSETIAEHLCAQAFGPTSVAEDVKEDLKRDFNI